MEKKQKVVVELCTKNNERFAYIKKRKQFADVDKLMFFLDDCRKKRIIKNGTKVRNNNYTSYDYDIKLSDSNTYSFEIKVKNSEKSLYYETIKYMESLCDLSATIKKVNIVRLVAGLIAGAFVLVNAGPHIVKEYEKRNDAKNQYQQELYEEMNDKINNEERYYPTQDEKKEALERYYENVEKEESEEWYLDNFIIEDKENETKGRSK